MKTAAPEAAEHPIIADRFVKRTKPDKTYTPPPSCGKEAHAFLHEVVGEEEEGSPPSARATRERSEEK
eukprot:6206088-Pleurochrysis_carterae.AAC.1